MTDKFNDDELMVDRKQSLRVATKLMFLLGMASLIYVFMAGLLSTGESEQANVVIDVEQLQPGTAKVYSIATGKLLVLKRSRAMIAELEAKDDSGVYAFDEKQNLADDMDLVFRSRSKALFVAYGIDPFYRCDVLFTGTTFKSVCVDVKYNLAGRVYKGRHAQGNLIVPDYELTTDGKLRLVTD